MNLSKLKRTLTSLIPRATRQAGGNSFPTPIQSWMRGDDSYFSSTLLSPFQQSIWVYTAISTLAQTVSSIPFRISRGDRSGENLLTHGPLIDLFNRPHLYLNRFRFWESIVTWYCLRGEAFLVALDRSGAVVPVHAFSSWAGARGGVKSRLISPQIENQKSNIANLLVLNPDQFRHIIESSELIGWRFIPSQSAGPLREMTLAPEDVIHDFLPNPYLFWRGLSPLSVAMLAAQTDYASANFMKGLMLNNADTGIIVRSDTQLAPEQREQIRSALQERKASSGTTYRPIHLWGAMEVIQPTLSSADLQFLENRKFNRQEICAAFFRIPQTLLGFTENANRAIAESERLNFIENSIAPLCARLEAAVDPIVKSFGPDLVGWFDLDAHPILQAARRNRVETATKLFSMGYPVNAINKALDLGLPHLPWGDQSYLPARLQQITPTPPSSKTLSETSSNTLSRTSFRNLKSEIQDLKSPSGNPKLQTTNPDH